MEKQKKIFRHVLAYKKLNKASRGSVAALARRLGRSRSFVASLLRRRSSCRKKIRNIEEKEKAKNEIKKAKTVKKIVGVVALNYRTLCRVTKKERERKKRRNFKKKRANFAIPANFSVPKDYVSSQNLWC